MSQQSTKKTIILAEVIGFTMVILLLWVDEIFDLPHNLLGLAATPINWAESLLETFFVVVLSWVVMARSAHSLRRIRYLEGFLPVCTFCNRIRVDGVWTPIDQYLGRQIGVRVSQGLCPECEREHYG